MMILGFVTFICSLPIFADGIEGRFGQDLAFHLMRIEGIATELRSGVFPVKMQSLWMEGYGYPVSVYYGDLLLYFPAVLRLAGVPVIAGYKIYLLAVNFGTVCISYYCFRRIFGNREIAVICVMAYVTSSYRYLNLYIRAAVGEYSAMMFLPLIALAVYRIYTEEGTTRSMRFCNASYLALGMTGLIGTHILTVEMVCVVLVMVCAILWRKTFTKAAISTYVTAMVETLLLNLYFIVPFLDYYVHESVRINEVIGNARHIQGDGAYLTQFFAFFEQPFSSLPWSTSSRVAVSPGVVLMLALMGACYLWMHKKLSKTAKFCTAMSLILLFVSSNLFPWEWIGTSSRLGDLLAQVQFPWRYVELANVFLTLLLGYLLASGVQEETRKRMMLVITAIICIMSGYFSSMYLDNMEAVTYTATEDLDTYDMGFVEYLRSGTEREAFTHELAVSEGVDAEIVSRRGTDVEIRCSAGGEGGFVELPILNYKGYYAIDENGDALSIADGKNNVIRIELPMRYEGSVSVGYRQAGYWVAAEILSLLCAIGLLIYQLLIFEKRKLHGEKV